MAQTSQQLAAGPNVPVRKSDHNSLVTDVGELYSLIANISMIPGTLGLTYAGRKLTQVDDGPNRWIINWNGAKVSTIVFQKPAGVTSATYTPTYSGRRAPTWTKT